MRDLIKIISIYFGKAAKLLDKFSKMLLIIRRLKYFKLLRHFGFWVIFQRFK